jgi:hypothetical protein
LVTGLPWTELVVDAKGNLHRHDVWFAQRLKARKNS